MIWHERDEAGDVLPPPAPRPDPRERYRRQGVPEHRIDQLLRAKGRAN